MEVFGRIFLFQLLLAVFVIFILVRILHHQLIEFALRELDRLKTPEDLEHPVDLVVTAHRELKLSKKMQLQRIAQRIFGADVKISIKLDKSLWGGVVLEYANDRISYGLKDRLKESGFIK